MKTLYKSICGAECGTLQSVVTTQPSSTGTAYIQTYQCLANDGDCTSNVNYVKTVNESLQRQLWNDTVHCDDATVEHLNGVQQTYQRLVNGLECAANVNCAEQWTSSIAAPIGNDPVHCDDGIVGHRNEVHTDVSVSSRHGAIMRRMPIV